MKAKLVSVNDSVKIDIDGQVFEPLSFKSFRPTKENLSEFSNAGIKLMSILVSGRNCAYKIPYSLYGECWVGDKEYNLDVIDKQIDFFIENAPESYFALMIHMDTRDWWLNMHPDHPTSYGCLSQIAGSSVWREDTAEFLQTVIRHVEEKYGDKIYGYYLLCGIGTEWLSDFDYQQSHPIKEKYFREYTNNPNAKIPSKEQLELSDDLSFNNDEQVKIYHRAHAELISDTILYFAKKAQEIVEHKKLIGLYYGYLLELKAARLWNAGHQAYEKIFKSEDIDIIASPSSYEYREPDSTGAFMVAHQSICANNKLYFFEFDQRTYLTQTTLEGAVIPPAGYRCKDDLDVINLMRRDFMLCYSNGAGLWWFDMWDGWFRSDKMLKEINNLVNVSKQISKMSNKSAAEVAVIVSGEVFYGVNKTSGLNDLMLTKQRKGLYEMGTPYDMYSLGDIEKIDISQYKLFIFLAAFEMNSCQDEFVNKIKIAGNKTILWAYAPKYINGGIKAVSDTVGLNINEFKNKPEYVNNNGELPGVPYLFADDDVITLDSFANGKPSVSYKKFDTYTSVYSSLGNLSSEFLRNIAEIAGVHIYCKTAPVYANKSIIGIYHIDDCEVYMPEDGVYINIFDSKKYTTKSKVLSLPREEFTSKLFVKE